MPSMALLAVCLASTLFAAFAIGVVRRLQSEVHGLSQRVEELTARVGAAEHAATSAALRAEVTESVLVGKGVADEEDLEEARSQFRANSTDSPYVRERDGEMH